MAHILVIEDEYHIQKLIRITLEKKGHTVSLASSGEEGLKKLEEGLQPDLVLLDILMPGIDGLQVLRSLKNNKKTSEIPVVMLTALAQENVVLHGIKLGAKDYIRKPFHPKELAERLTKFI